MKRLLVRLYPSAWRARYAEEFSALLDERPLGPWDVADIVVGAADAHLRGDRHQDIRVTRGGSVMADRRWGFAGIAGGALWAVGLFGVTFDPSGRPWSVPSMFAMAPWPWPAALAMIVGLGLLLAAVVGMSAVPARRSPRLVWASVAAVLVAIVAALVGLVGIQAFGSRTSVADAESFEVAWTVWGLAVVGMSIASGLFGIATVLSRTYSRAAGILLITGSALMAATVLGGATAPTAGLMKASWWLGFFFVGLAIFAAGWVSLGWSSARAVGSRRSSLVAPPT
jgi:hypothetical protein